MSFLGLFLVSGGITMDLEWDRQVISMGHLLPRARGQGSRKFSFKRVGRRAQLFSSLGPVKTKKKVTITSLTGTVNSNPVSHGPIVLSYKSGSSGTWSCSPVPAHASCMPGPHTARGRFPGISKHINLRLYCGIYPSTLTCPLCHPQFPLCIISPTEIRKSVPLVMSLNLLNFHREKELLPFTHNHC